MGLRVRDGKVCIPELTPQRLVVYQIGVLGFGVAAWHFQGDNHHLYKSRARHGANGATRPVSRSNNVACRIIKACCSNNQLQSHCSNHHQKTDIPGSPHTAFPYAAFNFGADFAKINSTPSLVWCRGNTGAKHDVSKAAAASSRNVAAERRSRDSANRTQRRASHELGRLFSRSPAQSSRPSRNISPSTAKPSPPSSSSVRTITLPGIAACS